MTKLVPISIRPTRMDEKGMPWVDYSCLNDANTCPLLGTLKYLKLKIPGGGRAMPLEAGSACHEVFATRRLWHHMEHNDFSELSVEQARRNCVRIFGEQRTDNVFSQLNKKTDHTYHTTENDMRSFCLQVFYDGDFYDDPRDKKRTFANLEECLYAYVDAWDSGGAPVWAMYPYSHQTLLGVELGVDVVIVYREYDEDDHYREHKLRYKGKADGLHQLKRGKTRVEENKTTSRISDAWTQSFHTSHQITGYCKAMQVQYDVRCNDAKLHGLAIPLPRTYDYGGIIDEPLRRKDHQYDDWMRWVLDTWTNKIECNLEHVERSVMNTGRCFDYFSLCHFFPMCAGSDEEEREYTIRSELETYEWDPEFR